MSRATAILLSATLTLAATDARAEDAGGLQCAMGAQKLDANAAICMPREPRNWIVCTGMPGPGGAGMWRDTTIACSQPPPKTPAEWGPPAEVPHPKPPAANAVRVIDLFAGIEFTCVPAPEIAWTADACVKIGEEWARQAAAAKIVGVVHDIAGDPEAEQHKATAAGLSRGTALQWAMRFKPTSHGGVTLGNRMTGVLEMLPGIYGGRAIMVGGELDMRADEAKAATAIAGVKQEFPANFQFLLGPR